MRPVQLPPPAPDAAALARIAAGLTLVAIAAPEPRLTRLAHQAATPDLLHRAGRAADKISDRYGVPREMGRATYVGNILRGLVFGRVVSADLLPAATAWAESQVSHPVVQARLRNSRLDFAPGTGLVLVPLSKKLVPVFEDGLCVQWVAVDEVAS
jgi:hypothetical protein